MKSNKLWRLTWIIGIYAVLISVLYLVVLYKVKWEDQDLNTYVYIYKCSNQICTSTQKPEEYYYSIQCEKDICPHITEINDTELIMDDGKKQFVYNYQNGQVVNDEYKKYKFINDSYYIVTNSNNLEGIIDKSGAVIAEFNYSEIKDFRNSFTAYKQNGKYGIDNDEEEIYIEPIYDDILLINSKYFAYKDQNQYYIASYETESMVNNTSYDFVYSKGGIVFVIKNNQIDILDENLKSKLLIKIDTYYTYQKEKEKDSLNLDIKNNQLRFRVYIGNDTYKYYTYDIKNNKLY